VNVGALRFAVFGVSTFTFNVVRWNPVPALSAGRKITGFAFNRPAPQSTH